QRYSEARPLDRVDTADRRQCQMAYSARRTHRATSAGAEGHMLSGSSAKQGVAPMVCPATPGVLKTFWRSRYMGWKAAFWCLVAVVLFSSSKVARATGRSEGNGDTDRGTAQPTATEGAYSQAFQTNLLKGSVSFAVPFSLPPGKDG